jgi:NADH-quinone oxidoreductase subunit L
VTRVQFPFPPPFPIFLAVDLISTLVGFFLLSIGFLTLSALTPAPLAFYGLTGGCFITLASFLAYLYPNWFYIQPQILLAYTWLDFPAFSATFGALLDVISLVISILVLSITAAVLIFAKDYMASDPAFVRFLSYISLFACSMVFMVISVDLVQLFFGWELIGLFSYLLVGFWNTRPAANRSALKAVFLNRIGDFSLFLLIVLSASEFGTTSIPAILLLIPVLCDDPTLAIFPYLILFAAVAKSAQYFLHDWLPDAMEGPTPVSSLLHSATMVTAGVFLLLRFNQIFYCFPTFQLMLASLGAATAIFGGLFAFGQFDLKKIIAYSTTANLGIMVFACALGFEFVALYHLVNHALFKAFLFICSGLFIHATGGRQDFRSIIAVFNTFPFLFSLFAFGLFCSAGFPSTPSFYSKDLLIALFISNVFSITSQAAYYLITLIGLLSFLYSLRPLFYIFSSPLKSFPFSVFEIPFFGFISLLFLLLAIVLVPDLLEFSFEPSLSTVLSASDWHVASLFQEDWSLFELSVPALALVIFSPILAFVSRAWIFFPFSKFFSRIWLISISNPFRLAKLVQMTSLSSFHIFFNLDRVLLESVGPAGLHRFFSRFSAIRFSFDEAFLFFFFTTLLVIWVDPKIWLWVFIFFVDVFFGSDSSAQEGRSIAAITVDCKSINGGSNPPVPFSRHFSVFSLSRNSRRVGFHVTFPMSADSASCFDAVPVEPQLTQPGLLSAGVLDPDLVGRTTFSVSGETTFGPSRQRVLASLACASGQPLSILSTGVFGYACSAFPSPAGSFFFPGRVISRSPFLTRWLFRPFVSGPLGVSPFCSGFMKSFLRVRLPVRPFLGRNRLSAPFLGSLRHSAGAYLASVFSQLTSAVPLVSQLPLALPRLGSLMRLIRSRLSPSSLRRLGFGFSHGLVFFFPAEARFGLLRSPLFPFFPRVSHPATFLGANSSTMPSLVQPCRFFRTRPTRLSNRTPVLVSCPFPFVSFSLVSFSVNFLRLGLFSNRSTFPFMFHDLDFELVRTSGLNPHCFQIWRRYSSRISPFSGSGLLEPRRNLSHFTALGVSKKIPFGNRGFFSRPGRPFINWRLVLFPTVVIRGFLVRLLATLLAFAEVFFNHFLIPRAGSSATSYLYLPISVPPLENQPRSLIPISSEEIYLRPPHAGWTLASEKEEVFSVPVSNLVRFPGFENYLPGPSPRRVLPRALGDLNRLIMAREAPRFYRHGDLESSLPGTYNQLAWGWDYDLGSPFLLWHSFVPEVKHYTFALGWGDFAPIRVLISSYRILLHLCLPGQVGLPSTFRTSWFSMPVSLVWGNGNFLRLARLRAILLERAAAKRSFQVSFLESMSELETNLFLRTRLALSYLSDGFSRIPRARFFEFLSNQLRLSDPFFYPSTSVSPKLLSDYGFRFDSYSRKVPRHRHGQWETTTEEIPLDRVSYSHPSVVGILSKENPHLPSPERPFRSPRGDNLPLAFWSAAGGKSLEFPVSPVIGSGVIRPTLPVSKTPPIFPLALSPDFDPVTTSRVELPGPLNQSSLALATRFARIGSSLLFTGWADKPKLGGSPDARPNLLGRIVRKGEFGDFYRPEKLPRFEKETKRQHRARLRALKSRQWRKHPVRFLESSWFTYLTHTVRMPNQTLRAKPPLPLAPGPQLPAVLDSDPAFDWHRSSLSRNQAGTVYPFSRFPSLISIPVQLFFPRISYQALVETWLAYPTEYQFPPRAGSGQSWLNSVKLKLRESENVKATQTTGTRKSVKEEARVDPFEELSRRMGKREPMLKVDAAEDSHTQSLIPKPLDPTPIERFKALIDLDYPTDAAIHDEQRKLLLRTALRPLPMRRDRFWFWRYFRLYEFIGSPADGYFPRLDHRVTGFSHGLFQFYYGRGAKIFAWPGRVWNSLRYDLAFYLSLYSLFPIGERPDPIQPIVDHRTGYVEYPEDKEPNPRKTPFEFFNYALSWVFERLLPPLFLFTPIVRLFYHFIFVLIPRFLISSLVCIQTFPVFALNLILPPVPFRPLPLSRVRLGWPFPTLLSIAWVGVLVGSIFPKPILLSRDRTRFLRNFHELVSDLVGFSVFPLLRSYVSLSLLRISDWLSTSLLRPLFSIAAGGFLMASFGSVGLGFVFTLFSPLVVLVFPSLDPGFFGFHYALAGIYPEIARFLALETIFLHEWLSFSFSQLFLDFVRQYTIVGTPYQFLYPILVIPFLRFFSLSWNLFFLVTLAAVAGKLVVETGSWFVSAFSRLLEALAILVLPSQVADEPRSNQLLLSHPGLSVSIHTFSAIDFFRTSSFSPNWQRFSAYLGSLVNSKILFPVSTGGGNGFRLYPFPVFSQNSPIGADFKSDAPLVRSPSLGKIDEVFTGLTSVADRTPVRFSLSFPYTFSFLLSSSWRISSLFAGRNFPKLGLTRIGQNLPWEQWHKSRTRRRPQGIWPFPISQATPTRYRPVRYLIWSYLSRLIYRHASSLFPNPIRFSPPHLRWLAPTGADVWFRFLRKSISPTVYEPPVSYVSGLRHVQAVSDSLFRFLEPSKLLTVDLRSLDWISLASRALVGSSQQRLLGELWCTANFFLHRLGEKTTSSNYRYILPFDKPLLLSPAFGLRKFFRSFRNGSPGVWDFESPSPASGFFRTLAEVFSESQDRLSSLYSSFDSEAFEYRSLDWQKLGFFKFKRFSFCRPKLPEYLIRNELGRRFFFRHPLWRPRSLRRQFRKSFEEMASMFTGVKADKSSSKAQAPVNEDEPISFLDIMRKKKGMTDLRTARAEYRLKNFSRRSSNATYEEGAPVDIKLFRPVSTKKSKARRAAGRRRRFSWARRLIRSFRSSLSDYAIPGGFSLGYVSRIFRSPSSGLSDVQVPHYLPSLESPFGRFWGAVQAVFGGLYWFFRFSLAFLLVFFSPAISISSIAFEFALPLALRLVLRPVWLCRTWLLRLARIPYLIFSWFYFQFSDWWSLYWAVTLPENRVEDSPFTTYWQTNLGFGTPSGWFDSGLGYGHTYLYFQSRTWGFVSTVRSWLLQIRLKRTKFILACLRFRFGLVAWLFPGSYHTYLAVATSARLANYDRFISKYLMALRTLTRIPNNRLLHTYPFYRDLFMAGPELSALLFRLPSGYGPVSFAYELSRFFRLARAYRLILLTDSLGHGHTGRLKLDDVGRVSHRLATRLQIAGLLPFNYSKLPSLPFLNRYRRLIRFRDVLRASIPSSCRLFFRLRPVPYLVERTYRLLRQSSSGASLVNSVSTQEVVPFGLSFDRPGRRYVLTEFFFPDKEAWERAIYFLALVPIAGFTLSLWLAFNLTSIPAILHQLVSLAPTYLFKAHTLAALWILVFLVPFGLQYYFQRFFPFGSSPTLFYDRLDRKISLFRFAHNGISHFGDEQFPRDEDPDPQEDMNTAPYRFYEFDQELLETYSRMPNSIYKPSLKIREDDQILPVELPFLYQQDIMQRARGLGRFVELVVSPGYYPRVANYAVYLFTMQNLPSWAHWSWLQLRDLPHNPLDYETLEMMRGFGRELLFNLHPLTETGILKTRPRGKRLSHVADWVSSKDSFNWRARGLLTAYGTVLRYVKRKPRSNFKRFYSLAPFSEVRFAGPAWFQLQTAGRLSQPVEKPAAWTLYKQQEFPGDEHKFAEIIDENDSPDFKVHYPTNKPSEIFPLDYAEPEEMFGEEANSDLVTDFCVVVPTIYYFFLVPRFTFPVSGKHPLSNRSVSQLSHYEPSRISKETIEGTYSTVPRPPASVRWFDSSLESPGLGVDVDGYHVSSRFRRYDESTVPYLPPHNDWTTKQHVPIFLWPYPRQRPQHDLPHGRESIYIPTLPRFKTSHRYILTDRKWMGRRPAYLSGLKPSNSSAWVTVKNRTDLPRRPVLGDLNRVKFDLRDSDSLFSFETSFRPFRKTLSDSEMEYYLGSVSSFSETPSRVPTGAGPVLFKAMSRSDKKLAKSSHLDFHPVDADPRAPWPKRLLYDFRHPDPLRQWSLRNLALEFDKSGIPVDPGAREGFGFLVSPTPFPDFILDPSNPQPPADAEEGETPTPSYFTPHFLSASTSEEDWFEPAEVLFEEEEETDALNNHGYRNWESILASPAAKISPGELSTFQHRFENYFHIFNRALAFNKRIDWLRAAELRNRLQAEFHGPGFQSNTFGPLDPPLRLDQSFISPGRTRGPLDTSLMRIGSSLDVIYNGFGNSSSISTTNWADDYVPIGLFAQTAYDYENPAATPTYVEDKVDRLERGYPNRFWAELEDLEDFGFNLIHEPIAPTFNVPTEDRYNDPIFHSDLMSPYYESAPYYPYTAFEDSEVETVVLDNIRPIWPVTSLSRQTSTPWVMKKPYQNRERARILVSLLNPYPHPQRDTLAVWSLPTPKFSPAQLHRRDRLLENWKRGRWHGAFGEQFDKFFPEPEFQKLKPHFIKHFENNQLAWLNLQVGKQSPKNITRWMAQALVPGYHYKPHNLHRNPRISHSIDGPVLELFPNRLDLQQHLETYFVRLAYLTRVTGYLSENPATGLSPGNNRVDSLQYSGFYTRVNRSRDRHNRLIKKRKGFLKRLDRDNADDSSDHYLAFGKQSVPVHGTGSGQADMWRIPRWNWKPLLLVEHIFNRIQATVLFVLVSLSTRIFPAVYQLADLGIPTATQLLSVIFPSAGLVLILLSSVFLKLFEIMADRLLFWSIEPVLWTKFRTSQTFFEEMRPGGSYRIRKVHPRYYKYTIPAKDMRWKPWKYIKEFRF